MSRNIFQLKIDEFDEALTEITRLKEEGQQEYIIKVIGKNLESLMGGIAPNEFSKLTEIGMIAQLAKTGATARMPLKKAMLIRLLKETGDFVATKKPQGGRGWYLKGLNLLLDCLIYNEPILQFKFTPTIEDFLSALSGFSLPVGTRLLLMREFERTWQFNRVHDEFFAALSKSPKNKNLIEFGIAFFKRLSGEDDNTLISSKLPRSKINSILQELAMNKGVLLNCPPV
jgi:hypothetical protein